MKAKWIASLLLCMLPASAQQWQLALPGYQFQFPRDYFNHPDYQTEWWYYTGNLRAADGHRFGFELTFFRFGLRLPKEVEGSNPTWRPDEIYLAHLALSDIDGKHFYHEERLNRAGPGLAGVDTHSYWNGNWKVDWTSVEKGDQRLQAVCNQFRLNLELKPKKPIVVNGQRGVSQKGPQLGEASHYISFTRLEAIGNLELQGQSFSLTGLAWMDHEFFSEALDKTLAGWDWFAIQLDNGEELMLYRLRRKTGGFDPYSSGTYVDAHGDAHFLAASDFELSPSEEWRSAQSGGRYPLVWSISIPKLGLQLQEKTALNDQELFSANPVWPSYWEGAVTYDGRKRDQAVHGVGYLEMTGYSQALNTMTRTNQK